MATVKYYKLVGEDGCNRGFQLKEGINVDPEFDPTPGEQCLPGLYFCLDIHVMKWVDNNSIF